MHIDELIVETLVNNSAKIKGSIRQRKQATRNPVMTDNIGQLFETTVKSSQLLIY